MNLDLNMGRVFTSSDGRDPVSGSHSNVDMNLEDPLDNQVERVPQVVGQTDHTLGLPSLWRQIPIPPNIQNLARELNGENAKTYEISDKNDNVGKNNGEEGSFFDCNICLAKETVVTRCGHLFCWPCIYRWLIRNPDVKECPVCKGEVNVNNVTPIYGLGNSIYKPNMNSCPDIPLRPHARRVESLRQAIQRAAGPTTPMESLVRDQETSNLSLDRILTSRGMRRQSVELTDGGPLNDEEVRDNHHAINSTECLAAGRLFGSYLPTIDDMNSIFRFTDECYTHGESNGG